MVSMRRYLAIFLVVTLILCVAAAVLAVWRAPARFVTLPNGMRVELLGTAAGGATFTTEKRWEGLIRQVLPSRFTRWIRPAVSSKCSSGTNSLTVFVRVIDPSGAPINRPPWQNYVTEDETGFRYQRDGGYCSFGGLPGSLVFGLTLEAFPRRQPDFLFHLLDKTDATIATLRVPNPVKGPFVSWLPRALPQTRTNGPVVLTLKELREVGNEKRRSARPEWILDATDHSWVLARARFLKLADATGNEGYWLSLAEPAWKVRTFVYRERPEDFSDGERLVLTKLEIPKPGSFVAIDRSAERGGVWLDVQVLAGAGQFSITNGVQRGMLPVSEAQMGNSFRSSGGMTVESWGSPTPFFLIEVRNAQEGDEFRFQIVDDQGRKIEIDDRGGYQGRASGARIYLRRFHPDDAKSVRLEVTVNRPLGFEFIVDPTDVRRLETGSANE